MGKILSKESIDYTTHYCLGNSVKVIHHQMPGDIVIRGISRRGSAPLSPLQNIVLNMIYKCFPYSCFPGLTMDNMKDLMSHSIYHLPALTFNSRSQQISASSEITNLHLVFQLVHKFLSVESFIPNPNTTEKSGFWKKFDELLAAEILKRDESTSITKNFDDEVDELEYICHSTFHALEVEDLLKITPENAFEIYQEFVASPDSYQFIISGTVPKEHFEDLIKRNLANLPHLPKKNLPEVQRVSIPERVKADRILANLNPLEDSKVAFSFPYHLQYDLKKEALFPICQMIVRDCIQDELRKRFKNIYGLKTTKSNYVDTPKETIGYLRFYTSCNPDISPQLKRRVIRLLKALVNDQVKLQTYMTATIAYFKRNFLVNCEIQSEIMNYFTRDIEMGRKDFAPSTYIAAVLEKITFDEIRDWIKEMFVENKKSISTRTISEKKPKIKGWSSNECFQLYNIPMFENFQNAWIFPPFQKQLRNEYCLKSVLEDTFQKIGNLSICLEKHIENKLKFYEIHRLNPDSTNPISRKLDIEAFTRIKNDFVTFIPEIKKIAISINNLKIPAHEIYEMMMQTRSGLKLSDEAYWKLLEDCEILRERLYNLRQEIGNWLLNTDQTKTQIDESLKAIGPAVSAVEKMAPTLFARGQPLLSLPNSPISGKPLEVQVEIIEKMRGKKTALAAAQPYYLLLINQVQALSKMMKGFIKELDKDNKI